MTAGQTPCTSCSRAPPFVPAQSATPNTHARLSQSCTFWPQRFVGYMAFTALHSIASLPPGSSPLSQPRCHEKHSFKTRYPRHSLLNNTCLPCLSLPGGGLNGPPTLQAPCGSAAETLCSEEPRLGSLACATASTSNRSLPPPGCSSSLASCPHSAENPPSAIAAPQF